MIINFSIKNFRSIKEEINLSFEASNSNDLEDYYIIEPSKNLRLLKLGIIYGANASGKTNILKALDFLRELVLKPLEKKTEEINFSPFLFNEVASVGNSFFSLEFIQNGVRYLFDLELNQQAIISEQLYFFNPNKALVYRRTTDTSKQISIIEEFGSKIKINKLHKSVLEANTLWNNTVLGGYVKTNIESKEIQDCVNWFETKLKKLVTPRTNLYGYISSKLESNEVSKKNIIELMQKADFNISDIHIDKSQEDIDDDIIDFFRKKIGDDEELDKLKQIGKIEQREIFFQHAGKYLLPYKDESEGTKRYYQFSGLLDLMIKNSLIFPIDEIESSLHPDLFKHLLLVFLVNAKDSQIIATTHYRELLIEKDILRNDAIWFTEKKDDGSTDLFSLQDFDTSVIRNSTSIFNAYKSGNLGAIPNLKDYYLDIENGAT